MCKQALNMLNTFQFLWSHAAIQFAFQNGSVMVMMLLEFIDEKVAGLNPVHRYNNCNDSRQSFIFLILLKA